MIFFDFNPLKRLHTFYFLLFLKEVLDSCKSSKFRFRRIYKFKEQSTSLPLTKNLFLRNVFLWVCLSISMRHKFLCRSMSITQNFMQLEILLKLGKKSGTDYFLVCVTQQSVLICCIFHDIQNIYISTPNERTFIKLHIPLTEISDYNLMYTYMPIGSFNSSIYLLNIH